MADLRTQFKRLVRRVIDKANPSGRIAQVVNREEVGTLRKGVNEGRLVNFIYTPVRDGKTRLYRGVEPYEIKGGYFWGWHRKHNSIHKFRLERLRSPRVTKVDFDPREFD